MAEVFISYSRSDLEYVDTLIGYLREAGLSVWLDRSEIRTGDKWKKEIVKAIEACTVFVIVMSPKSLESEWVGKELTLAEDLTKPVFPLLLEGECFPLLKDTQFEDLRDRKLPNNAFLMRLARQLTARKELSSVSPSYTQEHRNADRRLLDELWPYIRTRRLLSIEFGLANYCLSAPLYRETFGKYIYIRTEFSEKRFISQTLESAFVSLDESMSSCNSVIIETHTTENAGDEEMLLPHHKTVDWVDQDVYHQLLYRFEQALSLMRVVSTQHRLVVQQIKREFPEFRFEAGDSPQS